MRIALVATLAAAACGIDWPDASRGDDLPDDHRENGPLHRAGQPCLYCHGGPFPSAPEFVLAGTVYLKESSDEGLAGATITIVDAAGAMVSGTSNEAGNFFAGGGRGKEGWIELPRSLVFPISVKVALGGQEKAMRSYIGREGSCAECHGEPPGAALVGKVYVEDP